MGFEYGGMVGCDIEMNTNMAKEGVNVWEMVWKNVFQAIQKAGS